MANTNNKVEGQQESKIKPEKRFLLVEYTVVVKDTGKVIDTTSIEEAKKAGIYSEDKVYKPVLVIPGEGVYVRGFEEALMDAKEGEEKEIEIPPSKAYGERDPNKVKIIPLREFRRRGIQVRPGEIVEINGVPAVIRNITGGRVVVDFNHPLAGKTLIYKYKVVKELTSNEDKIKHLVLRRLRVLEPNEIKINLNNGRVEIELPEKVLLNENIQYIKKVIASDIAKYIDNINEVVFIDRFYMGRRT